VKILGVIGKDDRMGAVDVYRVSMPLTYLNKKSDMRCGWMPKSALVHQIQYGQYDSIDVDIVVLAKLLTGKDVGPVFDLLRSRGAKLVYETDDDYSGRFRPADDVSEGTWHEFLRNVDAITVSTKHLAKMAAEDSDGKPVFVCPNAIDLAAFRKVSMATEDRFPGKTTVMVAGTKTHQVDWRVVAEVMPSILSDHPEVEFLAGCERQHYPYLEGLATFVRTVPYQYYPALLRQADILCAPLIPDDQFNWSKSPIKAIEGWSAERQITDTRTGGCAVIATDTVPYRGVVQNRHNGLLVKHTPEAWDEAIRKLITDWRLRYELQREGLKDAGRYDIKIGWRAWDRAYKQIGRLS